MKYEMIIFDADVTLFDFKKSERVALKKTFQVFGIEYAKDYHLNVYRKINSAIWKEFEEGRIAQKVLKVERFKRLSDRLKIRFDPAEFAKSYMKHLSEASYLFDDSINLIKSLHGSYKLAIVSNGLSDVQDTRVRKSIIGKYFEKIVISEEVGVSKPDPRIFEYALTHIAYSYKSSC